MNVFDLVKTRPQSVQDFLLSSRPAEIVGGLRTECRITDSELTPMLVKIRDLMLGIFPVTEFDRSISQVLSAHKPEEIKMVLMVLRQSFVAPFESELSQTPSDVAKFKADNGLPSEIDFNAPDSTPAGLTANATPTTGRQRQVPTTSDIRPARRGIPPVPPRPVPPATAIKPEGSTTTMPPAPPKFQLRTVEDLINVSPAALGQEPNDEKQLVGRFKQEIQDIANYSGAKRTDIVAGWKQSRIYRTYIEMGNASIQQGKPIGEIMGFRKADGQLYLTENQFHAVSEVSRLLLR